MASLQRAGRQTKTSLPKSPTGIRGLDEITGGGLPKGRPTLLTGGTGCGKTLLAMEFLVRGATEFNEPGIFLSFEESSEELVKNFSSLGYDLNKLIAAKKLVLDYVYIERSEIEVTGEYDLEGLFVRIESLAKATGAKRVVLDTLEALFASLPNDGILRAELRRLFRWLKSKGLTAVITAEKGNGSMTRHGLEEYVSDCVISLDHIVRHQVATRRMRIVKYRGARHGTNDYPFLIDSGGISVLPITSVELQHEAGTERIASGIPRLDAMISGKGFFRGSSILVSGTAGTGKSSMSAHFSDAVCRRGERCLYLAFEESQAQIVRNMRSIGIDLKRWVDRRLLHVHAARPTMFGLEMHLAQIHRLIDEFKPRAVVFDPITNLMSVGDQDEVKAMLTRLIDYLKLKKITGFFTNLTHAQGLESTESAVSSLMDVWISLRDIELNGERNRGLYLLKSRGMAHSNQIREFLITSKGVDLLDVYTGGGQVLTGSARAAQDARESADAVLRQEELSRRKRALERKRKTIDAQIQALRAEYASSEEELRRSIGELRLKDQTLNRDRVNMAVLRKADRHSRMSSSGIRKTMR